MFRVEMGRRGLTSLIGICAALAMLPASAGAAPGDVFVVDTDYATGDGGVAKVASTGGPPSDFAEDAALFQDPWGMVMDSDRTLLIADYGSGKILRVSGSGDVTELFSDPSQPNPTDLAWGPDGFLYVLDYVEVNIFRLDPQTGATVPVADNTGVPDWGNGFSIVVARNGTIYFTDGDDELFKVAPGGSVTKLYEGALLDSADGLAISPDEKFLYVTDESLPTVVRVNRRTGAASNLVTGYDNVTGITPHPSGGFLAANPDLDSIVRVPASGAPIATFSSGGDYSYPHDIVIEPAACRGQLPTVVGTPRRDVIRGSRFADVIATLGGKDVVRGLAGKDIICGGGGPDRLIGGGARDTLIGGKGKDRLIGGKGRDKLRGGPGRDTHRQ
jgi:Ca2+-binding RTX toxin-like protein